MKFNKIALITLTALGLAASMIQARPAHRRHHGPRFSFGMQVGAPVAPVVYQAPVYVRPCCQPVVYHAPVIVAQPRVGFSFGSGPVGIGISF